MQRAVGDAELVQVAHGILDIFEIAAGDAMAPSSAMAPDAMATGDAMASCPPAAAH